MAILLAAVFVINIILCNGFPWDYRIPLDSKEIAEDAKEEIIRNIYATDKLKDVMKLDPFFDPTAYQKKHMMLGLSGKNCGTDADSIVIDSLTLPDVIVFGDNASVSAKITIKKDVPTASLLQVVAQKVGIPIDIPCMDNIGTCNYTNPCDLLKTIKCPPEIVKLGWNCRCPLTAKTFTLPTMTVAVPTIALPAFLVDGTYTIKAHLYNGAEELMCYQLQAKLKEK